MFRLMTIAFILFGGWLGIRAERFMHDSRCREAGGQVDTQGLCRGLR